MADLHEFLYFIFPKRCLICGDVIHIGSEFCEECAKKNIRSGIIYRHIDDVKKCCAPFYYKGSIIKSIHNYKFKGRNVDFAYRYSKYLYEIICSEPGFSDVDVICSIPSSSGEDEDFISSYYIAKFYSKRVNVKYIPDLLYKKRKNKKQHFLKMSERAENVRDLYAVDNKYDIKNKNILIIDDVITTGNTIINAALALKKAGAGSIYALAVAATSENIYS